VPCGVSYLCQYDSWDSNPQVFSTADKAKASLPDVEWREESWGWVADDGAGSYVANGRTTCNPDPLSHPLVTIEMTAESRA
jgi:hypothetical protein